MKRVFPGIFVLLTFIGTAQAEEAHSLRDVMKHLGMEVHTLSDGLLVADYEKVARAARTIAEHSHMSSHEEHRIHTTLGKDAEQFRLADERVHHTAMELVKAAQKRDSALAMKQYSNMMEGCIACHTAFRERLRTK